MSLDCKIPHPLKRQGTSQNERTHFAFKEDYVKIDERNILDLVKQSAEYSKFIKYYTSGNPGLSTSDWRSFFNEIYDFSEKKVKFKSISDLEKMSGTSPHIGLFLAFLQLFGIAQENLNDLTERHLKFYYEDVLQIKPKKAIPDKVVLFAEVSKGFDSVMIAKDHLLNAGKDSAGKKLTYKTFENTIVNKAKVKSLKTLFISKEVNGNLKKISITERADTLDGVEEPITAVPPSWKTFGSENNIPAAIGFGIWSPALNLPEGERTITLSLKDGFESSILGKLNIQYTSNESWEEVSVYKIRNKQLIIIINPDKPAFIPFDTEIHSGNYIVSDPILKITFRGDSHEAYNLLRTVSGRGFKVTSSVKEFKSLILQNDNGELDPSKPFLPFGNRPVPNSSKFIIGNKYAFNKFLTKFSLNLKPDTLNVASYFNRIDVITKAEWKNLATNKISNIECKEILKNDISSGEDDLQFNAQTKNNFIRATTNYNWANLNNTYLKNFITYAKNPGTNNPPSPPAVPELETISMDYTLEIFLQSGANSESGFFHIYPFGYDFNIPLESSLLPHFLDEGNLFIGISDLKSGQSISLYFQMKESSGDPDKSMKGIKWNFFSNNRMTGFKQSELIKDTTNEFTTSGIITFSPPKGAFAVNTIMPPGLFWIAAVCSSDCAAYPEMIEVKPQAFECRFENNNNDTGHLAKPLPPKTIAKFTVPVSGIKKIEQPYSSFGGKVDEDFISYKTRVSEILSHKKRGIDIKDYERMIMEEFPNIYKVKCISHSVPDCEYSPGKVLLIVVPWLYSLNTQDMLEPRVSIGERQKIKVFITKYTTPFARIEVINPVYEKLEVISSVIFRKEFSDKEYYAKKLNDDLISFLVPWKHDSTREMNFGRSLYKSMIIDFIDKLEYVDYISSIEIYKHSKSGAEKQGNLISTSNESVILTSYHRHQIDPYTEC